MRRECAEADYTWLTWHMAHGYSSRLSASRTYSKRLLGLMHGDAVHADLNGVSRRSISWTVCEVQLNGLD